MRFLIADDHPIIVVALGEMLTAALGEGAVKVDTVDSGESVLHALARSSYDCLVLDLDMPGHPRSVPLVAAAAQARPGLRIVIYTGHAHPCLALAAIEAGAQAYVSKASGARLALDAIRTTMGGERFMDPAIDLDLARNHVWRRLSPNERSILLSLARGENLQALAIDSQRSYNTVTAHKYNAIRKLGLRSNAEIGPFLARHGLDYLLDA
jgi:DNA-binding NarL/FixJ family response regulator